MPTKKTVKTRLKNAKDEIEARAGDAAEGTRATIRKRPLTSVAVAAGAAVVAGAVAGAVLARKAGGDEEEHSEDKTEMDDEEL